jgi:hypothetical protein
MIRKGLVVASICAVSLAFAHKIRVDFDHSADFGRYKTYSLAQAGNAGSPLPTFPNAIVNERIAGYIEEALAAKGLKRAPAQHDLRVTYRIEVMEQPQFITYSDGWGPGWGYAPGWGYGYGPGWGGGFATTTVQMYYQGLLVVDIVDVKANKVVFEGTSAQMVSSKPEKNNQKLAKAVNEVFARYPPR